MKFPVASLQPGAKVGVTVEAYEMAIQRMVHAGVTPITWGVFGAELQRDWARTDTVPAMAQILIDHEVYSSCDTRRHTARYWTESGAER